jgi:hypothetical protein
MIVAVGAVWANDLGWQWALLFALAHIADSLIRAIMRGVAARVQELRNLKVGD